LETDNSKCMIPIPPLLFTPLSSAISLIFIVQKLMTILSAQSHSSSDSSSYFVNFLTMMAPLISPIILMIFFLQTLSLSLLQHKSYRFNKHPLVSIITSLYDDTLASHLASSSLVTGPIRSISCGLIGVYDSHCCHDDTIPISFF
jgi:CII-binding regulator of phage lambda lysogenization HflD